MRFERTKIEYHRPFYDQWGRLNVRLPIPTTSRTRYEEELDLVDACLDDVPSEGEAIDVANLSCFRQGSIASWGYRFMRIPMALSPGRFLVLVEVYLGADGSVLGYSAPVTQLSGTDQEDLRDKLDLIREALATEKVLRRPKLQGFFEVERILN